MTDQIPLKEVHQSFKVKQSSKFLDPCPKETSAAMKCLDSNNYDKSKCQDLFLLYRECKKKWLEERRELRRQGLL
ncbi:cytochrome c oxidase-assembly factor cox23, mitochondrial [Gigaspora margarita]|uniref:Cytochrome c oxidase-assembly factor COX23, mitochondrial n=1 Tax=Gigaspora margarita TaxID=4874 RepID=A0A8H4EPW5_GIGMA|nr:cytochrome c oxidase-assembly factor cox23, mitochondrial [Gigaspora margarita]